MKMKSELNELLDQMNGNLSDRREVESHPDCKALAFAKGLRREGAYVGERWSLDAIIWILLALSAVAGVVIWVGFGESGDGPKGVLIGFFLVLTTGVSLYLWRAVIVAVLDIADAAIARERRAEVSEEE